jgi:hypothetical protein
MGCYVVNTSAADDSGKKKCAFALEDYYECLHHKKEVGVSCACSFMCFFLNFRRLRDLTR